jgi:aspartyl-tRNA synthetase
VRGIVVPAAAGSSRKVLDRYTGWARDAGAAGLVWIKLQEDGSVSSPALKALGEDACREVAGAMGGSGGDLVLLVADSLEACRRVLGTLRLKIAAERDLVPHGRWDLLWIEQFPLFEWDGDEERWTSIHHPFTAPRWEDLDRLESDPGKVLSQAYDLVLNGTEIGGGSIRIHRKDIQQRVFRALAIPPEEAEAKFGFLLRALDSGAPPHGGIALGFDRVCAMLSGSDSIRDVIAFPKTTSGSCLMTRSPSGVDESQLRELHLRVTKRN